MGVLSGELGDVFGGDTVQSTLVPGEVVMFIAEGETVLPWAEIDVAVSVFWIYFLAFLASLSFFCCSSMACLAARSLFLSAAMSS